MSLYSRLRQREKKGQIIPVAVVGSGLIGRGTVRQVDLTPGMRTALIVNRSVKRAVDTLLACGYKPGDIVVSDCFADLQQAIFARKPCVTTSAHTLRDLEAIEVVVEVTGAVEYGAQVALHSIAGGKHVIMMNAETDATVGCSLKRLADQAGVVYSNSDGDQPGVLKRLIDYVDGLGFEIVAAVNCKGFMDVNATPDSIRPWAIKQNTSLPMTTAFTDGTKMNIENAVIANATGLIPEKRGMHGVKTDLEHALNDCIKTFHSRGLVDYTLGGNFAGGVFVIGYGEDPIMIQPYMKYLKMGDGPNYLFFRPYHLCHMETPLSIAEAVLDHEPTIAPRGDPVVEVVSVAKRELKPGDVLDGIGGYCVYGEIDTVARAKNLLPIGMAEGVTITKPVRRGEPVPMTAIELNEESLLFRLRHPKPKPTIARMQVA